MWALTLRESAGSSTLALRENIDAKDVKPKHFEEAMKKVKSSILNEDIQKYRDIENGYIKTARSISAKDKEKSYLADPSKMFK